MEIFKVMTAAKRQEELDPFAVSPESPSIPHNTADPIVGAGEPHPSTEAKPKLSAKILKSQAIQRDLCSIVHGGRVRGIIRNMLDRFPDCSVAECLHAYQQTDGKTADAIKLLIWQNEDGKLLSTNPSSVTESCVSPDVEESATEPFPFMKLPPEVRQMVYREHLIQGGPIHVTSMYPTSKTSVSVHLGCGIHKPSHDQHVSFDASVLALLSVSKALNTESVALFYRHNDFHFEHLNHLQSVIDCIAVEARRSLYSICFRYHGTAPAQAMRALKECIGLRCLTIEFDRYSLGHIPYNAKTFMNPFKLGKLHGLQGLLKIRGIKELDVIMEMAFTSNWSGVADQIDDFRESLQVLKLPRPAAQLLRQEKKDYPEKLGRRTVFGQANVTTRMEKKIMEMSNK